MDSRQQTVGCRKESLSQEEGTVYKSNDVAEAHTSRQRNVFVVCALEEKGGKLGNKDRSKVHYFEGCYVLTLSSVHGEQHLILCSLEWGVSMGGKTRSM